MPPRTSSSIIIEGKLVLCENDGETVLRPGDAAGFKAGVANGHCLINRSGADAVYLEIGTRAEREQAEYPDIDLRVRKDENGMGYHAQIRRAVSALTIAGAANWRRSCPTSTSRSRPTPTASRSSPGTAPAAR